MSDMAPDMLNSKNSVSGYILYASIVVGQVVNWLKKLTSCTLETLYHQLQH